MPWAQGRYRTGRSVVLGPSLAGLFVLDTFLDHPDMFDDYVAITPSLWWDDGRKAREAPADLARHGLSDRRLYLTMADEGTGRRPISTSSSPLWEGAPAGLGWTYVDRSGSEEHGTMYMISALDAILARIGSVKPFEFPGHTLPRLFARGPRQRREGKCSRDIAARTTFEEKNADPPLLGPVPADEAGAATDRAQTPAERPLTPRNRRVLAPSAPPGQGA